MPFTQIITDLSGQTNVSQAMDRYVDTCRCVIGVSSQDLTSGLGKLSRAGMQRVVAYLRQDECLSFITNTFEMSLTR